GRPAHGTRLVGEGPPAPGAAGPHPALAAAMPRARRADQQELAVRRESLTTSTPSDAMSPIVSGGEELTASVPGAADSDEHRTYVLDTSVLLSDPRALFRFAEHDVVLPIVVVTELEAKRHHPELGYFARSALRHLDDLRLRHGFLDKPVPLAETGGTLRVELNHSDPAVLPSGMRLADNDTRILSVAANLRAEG